MKRVVGIGLLMVRPPPANTTGIGVPPCVCLAMVRTFPFRPDRVPSAVVLCLLGEDEVVGTPLALVAAGSL